MDYGTLASVAAAAVLSSGTVVALVGYVKDRGKDKASATSLAVDAAGDAVTTILAVLDAVRKQLEAARSEIAQLRDEVAAWESHADELQQTIAKQRRQLLDLERRFIGAEGET